MKRLSLSLFLAAGAAILVFSALSVPVASAQTSPLDQPPPAYIASITPTSAKIGETVTIRGYGFSTNANAIVLGSGVIAETGTNDTTVIQFTIPQSISPSCVLLSDPPCSGANLYTPNPGVYSVRVVPEFDMTRASNFVQFTIAPTPGPFISSVSPMSGFVGTKVTLNGSGFTGGTSIWSGGRVAVGMRCASVSCGYKNGLVASDYEITTTTLKFLVPQVIMPRCLIDTTTGSTCDPTPFQVNPGTYYMSATNDLGVRSNEVAFIVTAGLVPTPPPQITSISPTSGSAGTVVTVTGSGFSTNFNGIDFGPGLTESVAKNPTLLSFTVPVSVQPRCILTTNPPCSDPSIPIAPGTYGVDVVSLNGGTVQISNQVQFTVTSVPPPTASTTAAYELGDRVEAKVNVSVMADVPPSTSVVGTEPAGSPGTVSEGPTVVGANIWWQVTWDDGVVGWLTQNNLVPSAQQAPTASSTAITPFTPGASVKATANLNVRETPSLTGRILGTVAAGSIGFISEGPTSADGHAWFMISWDNGLIGWSVKDYLADATNLSPIATPPPAQCPIKVGDTVGVPATESVSLFVRSSPSTLSSIVGVELSGAAGTVVGGPTTTGLDVWWNVSFGDGVTGWARDKEIFNMSCPIITPPPPPPPPPAAPVPLVKFIVPLNGATVSGVVAVTVSVSSSVSIAEVDMFKDGATLLGKATAPPYVFNWDTTKEFNGNHTLAAVARPSSGSNGVASIGVTVTGGLNPPPSCFASPTIVKPDQQTTATGFRGAGGYTWVSDGTPATGAGTTYVVSFSATGTHQIFITDSLKVKGQCAVGVAVAPPPPPPPPPIPQSPLVRFITPLNGGAVSGIIPVTVSVSSSVSIVQVDLYKDGTLFGSAPSPPYTLTWNTTTEINGAHILSAIARASSGPNGTATISVTVSGGIAAPLVFFVNPRGGMTVSGIVPVTLTVSSSLPVTQVDLSKDNQHFGTATSSPYVFPWDTTVEYNGSHTLTGAARSAAGVGTAQIVIQVTGGIAPASTTYAFAIGDRVKAQTGSNLGLNVRSAPTVSASIVGAEPNGSLGTVAGGPVLNVDGYNWWQVKWDDGHFGWSVESFLAKAP